MRFFGDWNLKLSIQRLGREGAAPNAANERLSPIDALALGRTSPLVHPLGHPLTPAAAPQRFATRAAELARLLIAADPAAAFDLLGALHARAGSIAALCATLFEPVARALGDLWQADDCSEFEPIY